MEPWRPPLWQLRVAGVIFCEACWGINGGLEGGVSGKKIDEILSLWVILNNFLGLSLLCGH